MTMALVVFALIALTTGIVIIQGGTGGIVDFFGTTEKDAKQKNCDLQLTRVRQGLQPPEELPQRCREPLSESEWEETKTTYEEQKLEDVLTGN